MFVAIKGRRRIYLVAGGTEFRLFEQRTHDRPFMTGNVRENFFIHEITEPRRAIFIGQQGRTTNRVTPRSVGCRRRDRMTDRTGHAFVIKFGEGRGSFGIGAGQRPGKEGNRGMTGFAVPREFDAFGFE